MSTTATTHQVRFAGVGGQGIVTVARLLGIAASLFDDKEAVCTQAYGPEARGGAARADVVVSDAAVDYPFVTEADVLAALFHDAYAKFRPEMRSGGMLIVDRDLVRLTDEDSDAIVIPANKIAVDLRSKMVANIVMLGCLVQKTGVVSLESVEKAIRSSVKAHVLDIDLKALDAGVEFAQNGAAQ